MPRVTITVPDKNAQPYRFKLEREIVTLGRGSDNDIVIDCGSISVRHAEMRRLKGGYELVDVGSTNGMKYGDRRLEKIALHDGMTVQLGDVAFDFSLSEEEQEALKQEKPDAGAHEPLSASDLPPLEDEPKQPAAESAGPEEDEDDAETAASGTAGLAFLTIILALAMAFAGMAVRFQEDTGGSLIEAIKNKGAENHAPATDGAEKNDAR